MIVNEEPIKSWGEFQEEKQIKTIEIVPTIIGFTGFEIPAAVMYFLVAVAVAGITYLLTPIPEITPQEITQEVSPLSQSYIFGSSANLASQGQAVPLRYGLLRVGSSIISSRLTNENLYDKSYKTTAVYDPGYLWLTSFDYYQLKNKVVP